MLTKSLNMQRYRIDVYRQVDHEWKEIYSKDVVNAVDSISKIAISQSNHMFCFACSEP